MHKSNWITATLEDICQPSGGLQTGPFGSQLHASEYTEEGVPVVMPKDLINWKISVATVARIPEERANDLKRHRLKTGDIVFGRRGDIGRCAIVTNTEAGWICGSGSLRVRLNNEVSPQYLIYYLGQPHVIHWLVSNAVGQTMLNLSAGILASLPIELPPLPEQRKIAEILSTWDEAIDLTAQRMAAKQRRKQALMQRLLTGQVRFLGFISNPTYQQSNFGLLPQDWEVVKLGSVMKPVSRIVPVDPQKEYKLIGVRWYGEGAALAHNTLTGSDIQAPTLNHIWEDDILYNKMWTTKGAFAVAKQTHHDSYSTNQYPQFRAIDGKLDPRYFEYVFRLPRFQHDATALCRGTTGRARLNPQDFLKLEIPMPSIEEQCKIADFIYTCTDEIDLLQQKLTALRHQKQGLMQQLLTGKVRVAV